MGLPWWSNLPAKAADTGLIPSLGRFHTPQGNWAHAPQLLSLHTLQPLLQTEREAICLPQLEKARSQQWKPSTANQSNQSIPCTGSPCGLPCGSTGKESTCNEGDLGSIPGLGRCPGEGNGYLLQYSGLENSMDCIVHRVTESQTRLSNSHFHFSHGL